MPNSTGKRHPTNSPDDSNEPRGQLRRSDPGRTLEDRESRLIAKAYDLVEQRMDKGTATSQEVTHFLELGSSLAKLKAERLRNENLLLVAKAAQIEDQKKLGELYENAIKAMARYSGNGRSSDE